MVHVGDIPDYSATLLRTYNTLELLNYPVEDSYHFYMEAVKQQQEDRLYLVWAMIYTSPYTKDVPEFDEMRGKKGRKTSKPKSNLGMEI